MISSLLPFKCPLHNAVFFALPTAAIIGLRMMLSHNHRINRFDVDARFTDAIRYGNLVFMSGQVGTGKTAEEATVEALACVDAALKKAGTDKSRVVEITIWLADMEDYDAMNKIYDQWLVPGKPPCRACIQAKLAKPEYRVEIRAIATSC
eukprot:gene2023-3932_t